MPFLAPIGAAIGIGAGSAAVGAGINAISQGLQGNKGAGFQAQGAQLQQPVDAQQALLEIQQSQQALQQQQALANALQAQNGIGNQSQVFNQEQGLSNQLQDMVNGGGPNTSLSQLANTTGQNINQQAALMAGQRGAGANVGLEARQAAQVGANIQQQSVGQAAVLRQQQQLNAINALQGQQANQANLATQQVGQQVNATTAQTQLTQAQQQQLLNQINAQNQANVSQQSNINSANAGIAGINANNTQNTINGLASGIGAALIPGQTPQKTPAMHAEGGVIQPQMGYNAIKKENYSGGPRSRIGKHLHSYAKGGKVDALLSPGERYLSPNEVKKVVDGKKSPMKAGEKIPGKPVVGGAKNDYANDIIPKKLDAGGVVLPRSVTKSANPDKNAKQFLAETLSKKAKRK